MQTTFLIGNLAKDPEKVKGQELVKLVLAVNENYTKEDGTRPVNYFNIAVWGKLGEICEKYLQKGHKIAVIGRLQQRIWEDKDGNKKSVVEIVATDIEFLSPKNANGNGGDTKLTKIENDSGLPF